jgi:hypothetical protein
LEARNSREIPRIYRRERPATSNSGGRDQQIVSADSDALLSKVGPEPRVHTRGGEVEWQRVNRAQDQLDECGTLGTPSGIGSMDAVQQLGGGYRRDRHLFI